MAATRTHFILPDDLLADIDALVGPRGRSKFLVQALREAVHRRRLLRVLSSPDPVWDDRDHPELAAGADAWVRQLRNADLRPRRQPRR